MAQKWFLFLITSVVCFVPSQSIPPHVVFVVADDLGWNDVSWHNPAMLTPNLEHYARRGIILNDSYVLPVCTPSRNCFMTGFYPYHTGLQNYVITERQPKFVPTNFTLLPQLLKTAGYATHAVGKWHLGHCNWKYTPTERGFDTFLGFYNGAEDYYSHKLGGGYDFRLNKTVFREVHGEYSAMVLSARAEQIIRSHNQSKPLFLYLPFQSVHEPLEVPKRFEDMYANIQTVSRRLYCGMVSALDEAFGNVTRALEETGMDNNLLLIFTTDNGGPTYAGANNWPLRGAKTTTWQGGTRGSAFVYSKTLFHKTGYVNNQMIHAVDWFPTILDLAGVKPEAGIDGVSQLQTILKGAASKRTEFVYNIDDIANRSAIRWRDYKLIQGGAGDYNGWYPLPKLNDRQDWTLAGDVVDKTPEYMLFNVRDDPTEHVDLAQKTPDVLTRMIQRLEEWKRSLVPAQNPPDSPNANCHYYDNVWSPGWC